MAPGLDGIHFQTLSPLPNSERFYTRLTPKNPQTPLYVSSQAGVPAFWEFSFKKLVILVVSKPSGLGQVTKALGISHSPRWSAGIAQLLLSKGIAQTNAPINTSLRQTPGIVELQRASEFIPGLGRIQGLIKSFLGMFLDAGNKL